MNISDIVDGLTIGLSIVALVLTIIGFFTWWGFSQSSGYVSEEKTQSSGCAFEATSLKDSKIFSRDLVELELRKCCSCNKPVVPIEEYRHGNVFPLCGGCYRAVHKAERDWNQAMSSRNASESPLIRRFPRHLGGAQ